MTKVLIVDDDVTTRLLISKMLKQLGEQEIIYRPSNIYELKVPESHHNQICTNYTPDRDYGWYRKFEKKSKKRK